MKKVNNKKVDRKTIILIVVVLVLCLVVGISIGKYLFELTHPDINLLSNISR